jgi:hypothetical protein
MGVARNPPEEKPRHWAPARLLPRMSAMSPRFQVGLFSLAGALAIHLACSASGSSPVSSANADTPAGGASAAPPCTHWQAQPFPPKSFSFDSLAYTDYQGKPQTMAFRLFPALDLPDGWEPFALDLDGAVVARHCVQ